MIDLDGSLIRGIPDDKECRGVPLLVYDASADIFQKIQLRDNTEYEFSIELPVTVDEFLEACEVNPIFPFANNGLKHIVKFNGPDSCAELQGGRYRVTGRFNFENSAGTAYLDIEVEQGYPISIPVEVLTQKLDYYEEFQQLLHQISEYSASLLIRFDNATETAFGVSSDNDISPMAELMAFRRLFRNGRLTNYIRDIINNPSSKISSVIAKESAAFATNPDWATLARSAIDYDFMRGGVLQNSFSGHTPLTLPELRIKTSCDTKDNRFVKISLMLLRERLEHLKRKMPKKYEASHNSMSNWGAELDYMLFHPFWQDIGTSEEFPNSMVMVNRKGYREFMMFYLAFGLSIKLESETTLLAIGGDIKPVFHLYEMWCFLMMHDLLCRLTDSTGAPELSFMSRDKEFMRDLISKNDKPIKFIYKYNDKQVILQLYYNKDFNLLNDKSTQWADSYSGVFNPDVSISLEMNGIVHWLHFDAKYRLDLSKWKSELSGTDIVSSFKREDIHKMHTYRDAVLGTRGSYVLYPGSERVNELYVRNPDKTYRYSNFMPSVGAFPLKPTETDVQCEQLERISMHIQNCIHSLIENDFNYKEEYGIT
ncbi:DUF2357 domain-containing protein [Thalassolituus oleivorans]|uniref:DUF2357 domain-containing protein n=1 Tax=Thalassolituus oleivorans TaxID=187493 RepID=UPI0030C8381F